MTVLRLCRTKFIESCIVLRAAVKKHILARTEAKFDHVLEWEHESALWSENEPLQSVQTVTGALVKKHRHRHTDTDTQTPTHRHWHTDTDTQTLTLTQTHMPTQQNNRSTKSGDCVHNLMWVGFISLYTSFTPSTHTDAPYNEVTCTLKMARCKRSDIIPTSHQTLSWNFLLSSWLNQFFHYF